MLGFLFPRDPAVISEPGTDMERTKRIMNEGPAVRAGILVYDARVIEGFPGDALAK
jgi:hypothetical protein